MVWAMDMPSSFGEFFPGGEYTGYRERLYKYFDEEMSAEQKALFWPQNPRPSYVSFVLEKFRSPVGSVPGHDEPTVSPIESHEPPECFKLKNRTTLGSLIQLNSRILAVDEALKKIIEQLEPSTHQFFPIKMVVKKGELYPISYFTMLIGQYLDSFTPTKVKPEVLTSQIFAGHSNSYRLVDTTGASISGIAVSKAVIGTAQIWRELYINPDLLFFSDALQAEITKAGLRVPKHFRVIEV